MANNYIPGVTNAMLIGDGGLRSIATPTKVNGDKVNAVLELQSTTRAPLFMKPMTDAQIAAIPNPILGMTAVSSDSGRVVWYSGTAWRQHNPATGISYSSTLLAATDVQNMYATPFLVLPPQALRLVTLSTDCVYP